MPTPNPFDNPELFAVPTAPAGSPAQAPGHAPGHVPSHAPTQAPVPQPHPYPPVMYPDPRVDSVQQEVQKLSRQLTTVINHLRKQSSPPQATQASRDPQMEFTTRSSPDPVNIRTEDGRPRAQRRPYTIRLPQTKNAWPYFQAVAFIGLILLVIFLLFRGQPDPNSPDNQLRAAYGRSVQAVKSGSQSLSVDLMDIAKRMREQQMTQQQLDEALKESIQRAMLIAGEGPMKALEEIQPWDPDTVAGRLESSADAFSDIAKSIERLKRP